MTKEIQNSTHLFEINQDRVDFELFLKISRIKEYDLYPEWNELSSLLEHICGFTKFDAHRIAADEIIRRFERNCVVRVFWDRMEDILNCVDPREAIQRYLESKKPIDPMEAEPTVDDDKADDDKD